MPDQANRNEAETRAELIDPTLTDAGWGVVEGGRAGYSARPSPPVVC